MNGFGQEKVRQSHRKRVSLEEEEETTFRARRLSKWVQIQEISYFINFFIYWIYKTFSEL